MMEEIATVSDSNDELPAERLAPVGATSPENEPGLFTDSSRLQLLEEEQEQLNSSLMALTTHFAQVQFRLRQIIASPNEDKEAMLKELEEFAFRGCPNLSANIQIPDRTNHEKIIEEQRLKQKELIDKLKNQLQDLESYACQSGVLEMPSSVMMEKQKVIIDELKQKIDLPLDDLNKLSNDELKKAVDNAICQIVNPVKIKEQLVSQLKTQIADLERFIDFLQGEASSPGPYANTKGGAFPIFNQPKKSNKSDPNNNGSMEAENISNQTAIDLLKKVLSVMQIFALTQFGCGMKQFEKNTLKKSANHYGDLRANLEISINKVLRIYNNISSVNKFRNLKLNNSLAGNTESDDELVNECPNELIRAVRKDLACSLRDLMQHGLYEVNHGASSSMVPFVGCFVVRSKDNQTQLHVWDLITKYYSMKQGKEFTQSTANKLSQSFNLNSVSGRPITTKQSFLNAIDTIHKIHKNDISNKDSCFKAFVCLALNEKKLVLYLKQLLKSTILIENYYQNWSYIKTTGFDDALKALDQLKVLNPILPVDKSTKRKQAKELF